jgi:Uma2 family endonuclease
MAFALRGADQDWTAERFLETDQHEFGNAWRYELVDGRIVAHAAPSPEHGAILAGLTGALASRLRGNPDGCRPESGSGAVPRAAQRPTARIPDAMIRCGEHPRVLFEVISPSELRNWTERDARRRDLQAVEGAQEIVELYQSERACHHYRRLPDDTWSFEALGGADAILQLPSVGLRIPLSEIYTFADLPEPGAVEAGPDVV